MASYPGFLLPDPISAITRSIKAERKKILILHSFSSSHVKAGKLKLLVDFLYARTNLKSRSRFRAENRAFPGSVLVIYGIRQNM
jgi:hypothetical protein